jgi:tryptophanyl-tRNA synthetase
VPEHAELHLLLSMVTPLGWLERVPTYKEALENVKEKDLHNYGFLGYPVLQTADIVIYSKEGTPLFVPVGEDQVSHVELSREIVRRFDYAFSFQLRIEQITTSSAKDFKSFMKQAGWDGELGLKDILETPNAYGEWIKKVAMESGFANFADRYRQYSSFFEFKYTLTEPEHQLTQTPRIPGLDGRKMSKSYGNAITLSETDADIRAKTKVMVTDPARKRRTDPGNPDVCPVYDWHKLFSTPETLQWAAEGCRTAGIGCIECKAKMADHLIEWLDRERIRERRLHFEHRKNEVKDMIREGSVEARLEAQKTMTRVRDTVFGKKRILRRGIRRQPSGA